MNLPRLDLLRIKGEQYVRKIISNYSIPQRAYLVAVRVANQLRPLIQEWARPYVPRIIPTGSLAKGTGIRGTTDIDLLVSLPSTLQVTLDDIYRRLSHYLKTCQFEVREQNVSIGITYNRLPIDLIPARRQPGSLYDHSIYRRKARTWTKTNVHKHVLVVRKSGCLDEIRGIKIWQKLNGLEFPSFYLELSVINALRGCRTALLSSNLWKVFEHLAYKFEETQIVDPSNSNNIISDDLTKEEKQAIAGMAYITLLQSSWHNIIW
jgi:hypothetical protein